MKRILIACLCLAAVHAASAQDSKVFLKGGLNLANVSTSNDGSVDQANTLMSFQVGFLADLPLSKFVALQPGLLFTGKGAKLESGQPGDATYYKATSNPYYIELPLYLNFKIPLASDGSSFWVGAGPYVAMGIAGKNKADGKIFGTSFHSEESIKFSNDDPTTGNTEEGAGFGVMKRFDYGLNGMAGLELGNVLISANYGYGLAKLQSGSNSSANDNNKHRVVSLTLGFRL